MCSYFEAISKNFATDEATLKKLEGRHPIINNIHIEPANSSLASGPDSSRD